MNDNLTINDSKSLIYSICVYDMEKDKSVLFQVSYK